MAVIIRTRNSDNVITNAESTNMGSTKRNVGRGPLADHTDHVLTDAVYNANRPTGVRYVGQLIKRFTLTVARGVPTFTAYTLPALTNAQRVALFYPRIERATLRAFMMIQQFQRLGTGIPGSNINVVRNYVYLGNAALYNFLHDNARTRAQKRRAVGHYETNVDYPGILNFYNLLSNSQRSTWGGRNTASGNNAYTPLFFVSGEPVRDPVANTSNFYGVIPANFSPLRLASI